MIYEITVSKVFDLYDNYIKKQFENEIPTKQKIKEELEKNYYQISIYQEENEEKAYFIWKQKDDQILLFFFAVLPQYQAKGIGSKAIKEFEDRVRNQSKGIILEVENEKNGKSEEEKEMIKRRIQFYKKNGFSKIPNLEQKLNRKYYDIMISQGNTISSNKVKKLLKETYQTLGKYIEIQ